LHRLHNIVTSYHDGFMHNLLNYMRIVVEKQPKR